jgi:hypothetical protein
MSAREIVMGSIGTKRRNPSLFVAAAMPRMRRVLFSGLSFVPPVPPAVVSSWMPLTYSRASRRSRAPTSRMNEEVSTSMFMGRSLIGVA